MYQVFKNGRRSIRTVFASYDEARKAVRKQIRKSNSVAARLWRQLGTGDITSPNIGDFGYTIKKV